VLSVIVTTSCAAYEETEKIEDGLNDWVNAY
jgi:hypothetical protein